MERIRARGGELRIEEEDEPVEIPEAGATADRAAPAEPAAPAGPAPAVQISVRPAASEGSGRGARERVQAALRCPYCHDAVGRAGVVACRGDACGALYHRECWEETRAGYGACAVLGCGSTERRELSRLGLLYRLVRLFVAAVLFPPRVVRALRTSAGVSIYRAIRAKTYELVTERLVPGTLIPALLCAYLVAAVGLTFLSAPTLQTGWPIFWTLLAVPIGLPLLGYLTVFWTLVGFHCARAVLAGEVAALERGGRGGGSFLDRLRAGAGKK